jgi:hypothetical protein
MSAAPLREAWVEGVGFWASRLPGWALARETFRGAATVQAEPAPRPAPALLAPTERRRAPDSVAVALEVGARACQSADRDPKSLRCVFASMHGDGAITDYTCATLATAPTQMSPTKFHNSVHNAAAGYWTIGTGCMAPYTALGADVRTFAAGLVEALVQMTSEQAPTLYVAYDIEARGPLATVSPSIGLLGLALVLAPVKSERSRVRLAWATVEASAATLPRSDGARVLNGNAMAAGLPLFEAFAVDNDSMVVLDLSRGLSLQVHVAP